MDEAAEFAVPGRVRILPWGEADQSVIMSGHRRVGRGIFLLRAYAEAAASLAFVKEFRGFQLLNCQLTRGLTLVIRTSYRFGPVSRTTLYPRRERSCQDHVLTSSEPVKSHVCKSRVIQPGANVHLFALNQTESCWWRFRIGAA